ncbi:hypothetical protein DXG01_010268 [Tephrocybe rancida]|nr:hypothetical protein DXG01_010268 [Tephrocybe rancida]
MSNTINSFAVTRQINPAGATPVLTQAQVWKGLGINAREPKAFVPIITSCEVVSDEGNKLVRKVSINGAPAVTERVELHGEAIVSESTLEQSCMLTNPQAYFELESTGTRVTNIVSYDATGELQLTFSFANGIPGGTEGKTMADLNASEGKTAEHLIARIRELVIQGIIVLGMEPNACHETLRRIEFIAGQSNSIILSEDDFSLARQMIETTERKVKALKIELRAGKTALAAIPALSGTTKIGERKLEVNGMK